jgi:F-type H+-transporting ATPase subunit alpha
MSIYLGTSGGLDSVEIADVQKTEADFQTFMESRHPEVGADLAEKKELTDDIVGRLDAAIEEFKKTLAAAEVAPAAAS